MGLKSGQVHPAEFRADLTKSLDVLQQLAGKKVRSYRAPGFSVTASNTWVFDVLAECGIELDASLFPARRGHGGFPQFPCAEPVIIKRASGQIKEFPLNTASFLGKDLAFSGGGYFRLLPYLLIRRWMKRSTYVMAYFHPRDFDPGQPVIKGLGPVRRFKSYCGLRSAFSKFKRLLAEFPFVDLAAATREIDWLTVPTIEI